MSRLTLSDADRQVRDWFAATTSSLGCKVTVDEMGNQFAVKPGKKPGPPTVAGSHLDTQPAGGRYDGILGVTAGIEMLRVLVENRYETEYPVGVINWTNEEGARFPTSMLASGVWSSSIPLPTAHTLTSVAPSDPPGTTFLSALQSISYHNPHTPCAHTSTPLAAHFELHIEQGPHLWTTSTHVGVVDGVQAYRWLTVSLRGRESHTGTTGLHSRADALLSASAMVVAARDVALSQDPGALASVGIIEARPGAVNTVPGSASLRLDLRAPTDAQADELEAAVRARCEAIATGDGSAGRLDKVRMEWRVDSVSAATQFHPDCIGCVERAAAEVCGGETRQDAEGGSLRNWTRMRSGAGHDSVYTSQRVPTSMIFVPCRDGVSHNPEEFCREEDCRRGAEVLMNAVVGYDLLRKERGD